MSGRKGYTDCAAARPCPGAWSLIFSGPVLLRCPLSRLHIIDTGPRALRPHGKGTDSMRQLVFCSLLLLTGCTSVVGPFGPRPFAQVDDPRLPIYEQERRG